MPRRPDSRRPTSRRRRPGERAGLALEPVLRAARDIIVEEGLDALTMRRLAERLGVAPNALYSHFPDKPALVDGVLDALLAEVRIPTGTDDDWREALRELMRATRHFLLAHVDLIPLYLSGPRRGPNAMRLGEATLAQLERGGVQGRDAVDALRVLLVYTFGFAAQEGPRRADPDPELRRTRSEEAFAAGAMPRMRELAAPLAESLPDATFEKGLDWILAGIGRKRR